MKPVRIGMIGVGGVGWMHLKCLADLEAEGRAKLVCVADPTVERLPEQKAKLDAQGVRWHLDYRDMLAREPDIDAVSIITPVPLHFEMARACLERGLFVYLEKPPVPLIQQLDELIACDHRERTHVAFQLISSEPIQHLKEFIVSGRLGALRSIRTTACWPRHDDYYTRASWSGKMMAFGQPVFDGPATNALAHMINNIMFLAGETRDNFAEPVEVAGELYRVRKIESYDVASLRGKFASGVTFAAGLAHPCRENVGWQLDVRGDIGWARLLHDGARLESSEESADYSDDYRESFGRAYHDFVDFVQSSRSRARTRLADTRGYVLATNAALVSSDGIRNVDPEFAPEFGEGDQRGFDLAGIKELHERVLATGALYSELGAPWAKKPQPVFTDDFRQLDFARYC